MRNAAKEPARVAVIGGGYAGMAAATELARCGMPVTVFEAARVLGGRARRVETDGARLDNGMHILLGAYRETLRLIDLVKEPGAPSGLLRLPLELTIHPAFRLRAPRLPAPLHLFWALLGAHGLRLGERIAAARFMAWSQRNAFRLAVDASVSDLLVSRRQPDAVTRYLWNPLCVSALNTPPAQASLRTPVWRTAFRAHWHNTPSRSLCAPAATVSKRRPRASRRTSPYAPYMEGTSRRLRHTSGFLGKSNNSPRKPASRSRA